MKMTVEDLTCGYNSIPVLSNVSFSVETGDILCILGPNGVGKTTLFKSILGLLKPIGGTIFIDDENISLWSNKRKARVIGYIPQLHIPPFPYTVLEVVVMGRVAHLGMFASPTKQDYEMAEQVLKELEIEFLKDRIYTEISGGERQMVLIARALVQMPQILIMDEPTASLDYSNQVRVLQQIRKLSAQDMIIIMTTHAPDHAFLCSSKVVLIERGNRLKFGSAQELVTEENLNHAYGIDVRILSEGQGKTAIRGCVPLIDAAE